MHVYSVFPLVLGVSNYKWVHIASNPGLSHTRENSPGLRLECILLTLTVCSVFLSLCSGTFDVFQSKNGEQPQKVWIVFHSTLS